MPAKAKVTKEMIIDAGFAVAREAGAENISARTVSERLHCSTQPVMYHFATIEALKTCTAVMEQVTTLTKLPELAGASFGFVGLVYYQLFLVCGVAAIAGKDIHSNEVKTQCIECITVNAMARGLRAFTSKVITAILERYKLKGMEKGVDALVEFVLDWGAIKIVGNRAYKAFLK